jgi:nucleoside-diphosphate-sugar epimerase
MHMKPTCLVTGANGHLGNNLIRTLLRRDFQVRAGVRTGQSHVTYGEKCAIFSNISSFIINLEAMRDYHQN